MLHVHMLPAGFGDCFLIEYGDDRGAPRRVLIDGGVGSTLSALDRHLPDAGALELELLVVTHVDADHIGGILELVRKRKGRFTAKDVWFNGYKHLSDVAGAAQGEALAEELRGTFPWNRAFKGGSIVVPEEGRLPKKKLPGGASITLLSPYREQLLKLKGRWEQELEALKQKRAGSDVLGKTDRGVALTTARIKELARERYSEDTAPANGSSIAFLFEYGGRSILFGADAYASVLARSLDRLPDAGPRRRLDAFKLPHHGSKKNVSLALLEKLTCLRFLVSTDGGTFSHPDHVALARVLAGRSTSQGKPSLARFYFNYASELTTPWDNEALRNTFGYEARFPDGDAGLTLRLKTPFSPALGS